jgi:hypothetical protein
MLQTISIKSLAIRVLQEMSARKSNLRACPDADVQEGQGAGQPTSATSETTILRDVADPSLRECMKDSVRQFGQPHARLFPLIGKRVWTPQGSGKLLSVFASRCEIWPDGAEHTFRVRPEEVQVIQ